MATSGFAHLVNTTTDALIETLDAQNDKFKLNNVAEYSGISTLFVYYSNGSILERVSIVVNVDDQGVFTYSDAATAPITTVRFCYYSTEASANAPEKFDYNLGNMQEMSTITSYELVKQVYVVDPKDANKYQYHAEGVLVKIDKLKPADDENVRYYTGYYITSASNPPDKHANDIDLITSVTIGNQLVKYTTDDFTCYVIRNTP